MLDMKLLLLVLGVAALASAQDLNNVHFLLYTRDNMEVAHEIMFNAPDLGENYKSWVRTVMITHSHEQTGQDDWIQSMKQNLLNHNVVNVIIVDWGAEAFQNYGNTQDKVRIIGEHMGAMFNILADNNQNLTLTHCIGFGLGAHACGFAGKVQTTERRLARITGLEPRKERYDYGNPAERLAVTDAIFVDVMHTCDRWSFDQPMGHADFYPNGGTGDMPGCGLIELTGLCSHERAYIYYIESISTTNFVSKLCGSWRDYK
ncbi:hypothetical protein B566_EDAN005879, partial [Ephemera danica]